MALPLNSVTWHISGLQLVSVFASGSIRMNAKWVQYAAEAASSHYPRGGVVQVGSVLVHERQLPAHTCSLCLKSSWWASQQHSHSCSPSLDRSRIGSELVAIVMSCLTHPDSHAHPAACVCGSPATRSRQVQLRVKCKPPSCCPAAPAVLAPRLKEVFPETAEQLLKRVSRRDMHIRTQSPLAALCLSSVTAAQPSKLSCVLTKLFVVACNLGRTLTPSPGFAAVRCICSAEVSLDGVGKPWTGKRIGHATADSDCCGTCLASKTHLRNCKSACCLSLTHLALLQQLQSHWAAEG